MTETTSTADPVAEDQRARRRADVPNHYREALANLALAVERVDEEEATSVTHATLALAHATMLQANEQRVGNLIAYLGVLRSTPLAQLTATGKARLALVESRIDAALGTDEIQVEVASS